MLRHSLLAKRYFTSTVKRYLTEFNYIYIFSPEVEQVKKPQPLITVNTVINAQISSIVPAASSGTLIKQSTPWQGFQTTQLKNIFLKVHMPSEQSCCFSVSSGTQRAAFSSALTPHNYSYITQISFNLWILQFCPNMPNALTCTDGGNVINDKYCEIVKERKNGCWKQ